MLVEWIGVEKDCVDFLGEWYVLLDGFFLVDMIVLGDVYLVLEGVGLIFDFYYGWNEYKLWYLVEKDWVLIWIFDLGDSVGFEGWYFDIDYFDMVVIVLINDIVVLQVQNVFCCYCFDVSYVLKIG